ncbi:unnamed protein product [Lactuca saligna]|uniref:Uncharacterized protein n=1 Tax=Lactuca saligna TaxID=75948 RepID=A0AA35ZSV6_LACSI|nr:unnamed protein product [Lactuca saligna]
MSSSLGTLSNPKSNHRLSTPPTISLSWLFHCSPSHLHKPGLRPVAFVTLLSPFSVSPLHRLLHRYKWLKFSPPYVTFKTNRLSFLLWKAFDAISCLIVANARQAKSGFRFPVGLDIIKVLKIVNFLDNFLSLPPPPPL